MSSTLPEEEKKNDTQSLFESQQDRIEYLKARGIEIDVVHRKDTNDTTTVTSSPEQNKGLPSVSEAEEIILGNNDMSSPTSNHTDMVAAAPTEGDTAGGDGGGTLETMTSEQRQQWLKDHGVEIIEPDTTSSSNSSTKQSSVPNTKKIQSTISSSSGRREIKYIKIPCNASDPIEQCVVYEPILSKKDENDNNKTKPFLASQVDVLLTHLKSQFAPKSSSEQVDISLFDKEKQQLLSSHTTDVSISNESLTKVAQDGHVEIFTLVHPRKTNQYTSIQIYLDEVGMLKRLPLNSRALKLANLCGYDPPPKFYGDIYVGRMKHYPSIANIDFMLGDDLPPNFASSSSLPTWIRNAMSDNMEYQLEHNKKMGIDTNDAAMKQAQMNTVGENGNIQKEDTYSWTQTNEEIEITIPLSTSNDAKETVTTKNIHVSFHPKRIIVKYNKQLILSLDLYATIDPDGCTWTLEKSNNILVVSCEKLDGDVSWPRITL